MTYNPDNQYRCTIIRGKSQTEMEDMLPFYANVVSTNCPCTKEEFQERAFRSLSKFLFGNEQFDSLPGDNQKTIRNHITEIAGKLLGLYYIDTDGIVRETESCAMLLEKSDFPLFFKNLCLKLQFPNASQKIQTIEERLNNHIHIKPLCFVVALLSYANSRKERKLLTKQEIGYYVLNNLDVLQGTISVETVYEKIMEDRRVHIHKEKLQGSRDWQHIKEQFNLLALSNITCSDNTYVWLNEEEDKAISIFIRNINKPFFNITKADFSSNEAKRQLISDWGKYYGTVDKDIASLDTKFNHTQLDEDVIKEAGAVGLSTTELGDQGEMLIYKLECERVANFNKRLLNKVLLLGKTKGLGYDIKSVEANENIDRPEFDRYIEVKSTKRSTEPKFDSDTWCDSLNLTSKEWIAAEQYGDYYNIYRVYFTKTKSIVVRIKNPFKLYSDNKIEVFPTIYQMNFNRKVIRKQYEQTL